jgi:hypothetical protein
MTLAKLATALVLATVTIPSVAALADGTTKNQPPALKLKLGHYKSERAGIGVVIDLSGKIDNAAKIAPAKIKFDGENKVWVLNAEHGGFDRLDWRNADHHLMLQTWPDGKRSVYVFDPDSEKMSEEIHVFRDGDADPL